MANEMYEGTPSRMGKVLGMKFPFSEGLHS